MSSDTEDDLNTDKEDDLSGDAEDDSDADKECNFDPSLDFSKIDDNDFDPSLDFGKIDDNDFDPSLDFSKIDDNEFDPSLDFSKIDDNEFDPSLNFNEEEKNQEGDGFEPIGDSDGSQELDSDGNKDDIDDQSSNPEQENESYENLNSESTSTVLISDNREEGGENLQNDDQNHDNIEEINQEELDKEIEKELEEGVEAINQYLEEEAEFINAYQEMVAEARELDGEREGEGQDPLKTEEEWEKEIETAAYNAEQLYEGKNEIENNANNEELSDTNEEHETEKEAEQSKAAMEPQLSDLQEEIGDGMNEIEQHQVEPLIEEALETEPEPIVNENELEQLQELDLEEQFKIVHDNESIEELIEWQNEQMEQEKEEEVEAHQDNSKEKLPELEEEFEEGMNEIEQHQVEPLIEEALESIHDPIVNEKEIEELQELYLEEQFQTINFYEYIEELVEQQEEEKTQEHDKMEQEKEKIEQKQEILYQSTYLQEELEEQEQELELEYEEKDEIEQHQVETAIEEELETEPKPIIKEEELEYVKNFELEKQLDAELLYELIEELANKQNEEKEESEEKEEYEEISPEEKVAQIMRELEIIPETKSGETKVEPNRQEEELEHETTPSDVPEQSKKIEQEAFNEIESREEDSNQTAEEKYEKLKRLYKEQTGKRPIYANQETKGFKQWLEQKKESEEKEKSKQKQESKEEQKKEEAWEWTLKNWIVRATEIDRELQSELLKLVEKYNEIEKLIKKYSQLYNKAQREKLSRAEEKELKTLIKVLKKIDPIKIELFLGLKEMKRYLDEQYYQNDFWDKPYVNRIRHHFFTRVSQKYKNLKQAQKKKEKSEEMLKNWIERSSEEEISSKLKAELKELIENYNELDMVAIMFMKLYTKAQNETISKTEQEELDSLVRTLQKIDPSKIELFSKIRVIRHYLNDQHLDDFSDKKRVNRVLSHFFKPIPQKILKLKELINPNEKLKLKKYQLIENQEYDHSLDLVKQQNSLKNVKKKQNLGKVLHSYPDIEVKNIWKPLFEKLGNFKNVAKELNKLYKKTERLIWPETVSNRIQKLFKSKKEYNVWYNKYAKQKSYSEEDIVKIWKPLFEKLGSYNAVKRELNKTYHGNPPRIETIIYRLQKLFEDHPEYFEEKTYNEWFLKYTKQYHDNVVKNWIKLFEEFGNYRLVKQYLESQNGRIPSVSTIRRRVKTYFEKNGLEYFTWINQYESASHYYSNDILIWKQIFEEIGTYRGVALRFEQIDGRRPSHKNIKLQLKKFFLSDQQNFKENSFKEWEGKFGRYFHLNPIIERWIGLYKRYGSFYSVHKIEKFNPNLYYKLPTTVETIIKQVQNYLKDDFDTFYKKFHNPTPIPLIREEIINELHKNPPKSLESIAIMLNTNRKTVAKYAHEEFDPIEYEERWYNEIPQSIEHLIIEYILNSQLTLRRIAEKWDVSRTPVTRLAKRICPNFRDRFPLNGYLLLGTLVHSRINSILTAFFTSKSIKYFSEVPIFPKSWKRADGFLFNDNDYVNNLVLEFGLKNIIGIQFEFTFDLSEENILEKILKYQHPNILLLIIETNWDYSWGIQLKNANIMYPQNIKIINPFSFAKLIHLKNRFRDNFRELLEFSNINNLNNLKSLVNLDITETNKMHELKEYLEKKGYSIESYFGISGRSKKTLDDF